jgi:hypothetical protein
VNKTGSTSSRSRVALTESGATFDNSGKYRYLLWREWDADKPACVFIMLNPSSADATRNDPTIRRAMSFAERFGFGRCEAVNLFAYRATDSSVLARVRNPVGKENDQFILESIVRCDACFVAWGNLGLLQQRSDSVLRMIPQDIQLQCLGINKSGEPKHPLYLPNNTEPLPFGQLPR